MYFNDYEEKIIDTFLENLDEHVNEIMELVWENVGKVKARFDTCFDDDNDLEMDEDGYEEFTSFAFKVVELIENPPIEVTEDKYFLINYHNFPKEILVNGKKIN